MVGRLALAAAAALTIAPNLIADAAALALIVATWLLQRQLSSRTTTP